MDRSTKQALLLWIMFAPFIWCTGSVLFIFWSFFCFYYAGRKQVENGETREQQFNREPWTKEEDPEIVDINLDINLSDEEKEYLQSHPWMYKVGENKYEPKWKYIREIVMLMPGYFIDVRLDQARKKDQRGEINLEEIAKEAYEKEQQEIKDKVIGQKLHEQYKKDGLLPAQQHFYYRERISTQNLEGDAVVKYYLHNYDKPCLKVDTPEKRKYRHIDKNTFRIVYTSAYTSLTQIKKQFGDDLSLCPDCFPDGVDPRDEGVE